MKKVIYFVMFALLLTTNCFAAEPAYDYRNIDVKDINGVTIKKPIAQFRIKLYDKNGVLKSTSDIPEVKAIKGDYIIIQDLSTSKHLGTVIDGWDLQYYGCGYSYNTPLYGTNRLSGYRINLNQPGNLDIYLCVRNSAKVSKGKCEPWSENGNHRSIGYGYTPEGMFWYFEHVKINVQPEPTATVTPKPTTTPTPKVESYDFEVSKIQYTTYSANKNVNAIVTFKNNSSKLAKNVPVKISIKNKGNNVFAENRTISMKPNSSYDIYFPFKTPDENTTLKIQADINYNGTFTETKKDNNSKTIDAKVEKDFVPFGCTEKRTWTESHFSYNKSVPDGVDAAGNPKYKNVPVYQDYSYTAELKGSASIYFVADPGVASIKSGYGFRLEVDSDVVVSKQNHIKDISRINEVKKATKATVYFLGNPYPMEIESASGYKVKFYLPKNLSSVSGARKIYIPVSTPDGTYDVTIKIEGADSPGGDLCKTIRKQITVKGSMFEDDVTRPS